MNTKLLIIFATTFSSLSFAQTQITNGDMEQWETVASDQEPVNWNSFLTAGGSLNWAAANQIASSTDVRPLSAGTLSCRIWSRSTFGIVANGNVTLGKINMGSSTPSNSSNYNQSVTADPNFSEDLTGTPDSIVFWAKFTPINSTDNARMKATLHDAYDYRDPEDAASTSHVVATAVLNYPTTNGNWVRFAVPFVYSGPATVNTNILVTFTTNEAPGGGAANDEVLIDDVELIYNPTTSGVNENKLDGTIVSYDNLSSLVRITSSKDIQGDYEIINSLGQVVQQGAIENEIEFTEKTGMYFVVLTTESKKKTFKILKL